MHHRQVLVRLRFCLVHKYRVLLLAIDLPLGAVAFMLAVTSHICVLLTLLECRDLVAIELIRCDCDVPVGPCSLLVSVFENARRVVAF